jgi:hypothetical protein
MEATDFGCDERFMRLLKLDASLLVHPTLQHSSRLSILIGSKDERENRRQQECDGEERSNDQDATALGRCEELAGSAAKGRELRRGQPCFSGVSLASPGSALLRRGPDLVFGVVSAFGLAMCYHSTIQKTYRWQSLCLGLFDAATVYCFRVVA